jgi:hypothetical protein
MNISTVRDNLRRTIAGKEALLNSLREDDTERYYITKQILDLNLDELRRILADVEKCCQESNKEQV